MSNYEDRIDPGEIDLLARAIAAGKDVREMLMLAAHLGAEAANNGATDLIDINDPNSAAAMDSALRRFRANERTKASEQIDALHKSNRLAPRTRARVI